MAQAILARAKGFAKTLAPNDEIEDWLVGEIARGTVQVDTCNDQLLLDDQRVALSVDTSWEDDRCEQIDKVVERLSEKPLSVSRTLQRSKQGTDLLLSFWEGLEEVLQTNQAWDEPQRQLAFDMLGVRPELRSGSKRVPSGTNVPALQALVDRERKRLQTKLEHLLIPQDKLDQESARCGIPTHQPDSETRRLRSNQARAQRRVTWALDTFLKIRQGLPPAQVIDPETRRTLPAEVEAARKARSASAPAPTPAQAATTTGRSPSASAFTSAPASAAGGV